MVGGTVISAFKSCLTMAALMLFCPILCFCFLCISIWDLNKDSRPPSLDFSKDLWFCGKLVWVGCTVILSPTAIQMICFKVCQQNNLLTLFYQANQASKKPNIMFFWTMRILEYLEKTHTSTRRTSMFFSVCSPCLKSLHEDYLLKLVCSWKPLLKLPSLPYSPDSDEFIFWF